MCALGKCARMAAIAGSARTKSPSAPCLMISTLSASVIGFIAGQQKPSGGENGAERCAESARRHDHDDLAALETRLLLDLGDAIELAAHALEQFHAEMGM